MIWTKNPVLVPKLSLFVLEILDFLNCTIFTWLLHFVLIISDIFSNIYQNNNKFSRKGLFKNPTLREDITFLLLRYFDAFLVLILALHFSAVYKH